MQAKILIISALFSFTALGVQPDLKSIMAQAEQLEAQGSSVDKAFVQNLKQTVLQVEAEIDFLNQNDPNKLTSEIKKQISDLTLNAKNNKYKTLHPLFQKLETEEPKTSNHLPQLKSAILIINKSTLKTDIKETLNAKILYTIQLYQRLEKSEFLDRELKQLLTSIEQQKTELEKRLAPKAVIITQDYSLFGTAIALCFMLVGLVRKRARRKSDEVATPSSYASILMENKSATIFAQSQIKFWIEDFIDEESLKKNVIIKNIKDSPRYQQVIQKMVAEPTILVDSKGNILNTNDQFTSVFADFAPLCKTWDELTNHSYANEFDPVTSARYFGGENFARYGFRLFGEKQEFEAQCLPLKNDNQENVYLIIFSEIISVAAQPTTAQLSA
ncbi:MAG: hypothetical protein JNM93_09660 [Bacteriovoracaceae bacterium]|nr:hypothetical protein [Bacteriovoracaceae bacterium]